MAAAVQMPVEPTAPTDTTLSSTPMTVPRHHTAHLYSTPNPPEDHVETYCHKEGAKTAAKNPNGVFAPAGLVLSNIAAPLFLYTQLKGRADLWDKLLKDVPEDLLRRPTLDVGCARGLIMLKCAERKKSLNAESMAYGVTADDEPEVPAANAAAIDVIPYVAVHSYKKGEDFPFADGSFSLVTSSLALNRYHYSQAERDAAVREMIRVCAPGGSIIIVDLMGSVGGLRDRLVDAGWAEKDMQMSWAGPGVMYGMHPAHVLVAKRPEKEGQ